MWRNSDLRFGSVDALIASLEARTEDDWLSRARDADDVVALKALAEDREVRRRATTPAGVKLLWEVCRIPDFRGISASEHASMLGAIHGFLHDLGRVPDDWLADRVRRIDRTEGDIDALSKRLAYIRTWTYVAQRKGWVDDEAYWRETTRAVEDRLSDALHGALTQRFVDRRTSVLLRKLKQKEALVAQLSDAGEVTVEGQPLGRLEGFRFRQGASAGAEEARAMRQAAQASLSPEFNLRADRFYNAPDSEIDYTEQGGLMWGEHAVGKLVPGDEPLRPKVQAFVDEEAGPEVRAKVERRLGHFVERRVQTLMEPLVAMQRDETLTGLARGFAFRLVEGFGVIPRAEIAQEVRDLDQEARAALRKHGIRFGQFTVFLPALLKPAPTRLRLVLWSLSKGLDTFPEAPPPGLVTIAADPQAPAGYATMSGYREAGERAIRIDMLERLADMLRAEDSRSGFEAKPGMLSITGTTLEQFAHLMEGLGYRAERAERPKVKAQQQPGEPPTEIPGSPPETPGDLPGEVPPAPDQPDIAPDPAPEVPDPDVTPGGDPELPDPDVPERGVPETPVEVPDAPSERPGQMPGEVPPTTPDMPEIPPGAPGPGTPAEIPPQTPGMAGEAASAAPAGDGSAAAEAEAPRPGEAPSTAEGGAAPASVAEPAAKGGSVAAVAESAATGEAGAAVASPPMGDAAPPMGDAAPEPGEAPAAFEGDPATGATAEPLGEPEPEPEPEAETTAETRAGADDGPLKAGDEAPAEVETYYTFTWAGRSRGRGGNRDGRSEAAGAGEGARRPPRGRNRSRGGEGGEGDAARPAAGAASEAERDGARRAQGGAAARGKDGRGGPRGKGNRDGEQRGKDHRGGERGGASGDQSPKRYTAGSSRDARRDRIDPDNPFAAALMGLRDKE